MLEEKSRSRWHDSSWCTSSVPVVNLKTARCLAHSESDGFSALEEWIVENLKSDLRVQALARRAHMSPRNFARAYAQTRGRTPAKAIEAIRIDAARRRLEESNDRIETVAAHTGFTGEEQMRGAFIRSLGIPPREYRKRFTSTASS
jgi:transcriptional regulator GlxA family with amidase domain